MSTLLKGERWLVVIDGMRGWLKTLEQNGFVLAIHFVTFVGYIKTLRGFL